MKPLVLGSDASGATMTLPPLERRTHMHVIGSSGSGKSKFLESMIRQDLRNGQGFCLIDPHGTLYRDVLDYCSHHVLKRNIVLLNLSEPSHIVAFNPFRRAADADVSVQVDRRIIATMHAWGVENSDLTPTLERMLRLIYTMLIEQSLPFQQAEHLIDFNARQIREQLIQNVSSPLIRKEWQELQALSPRDWRAEVLSAKNRLFRLLTSTALSRFFNPAANAVDVADIVEKGKVLLVNLAASDQLSSENARVFGALLVNEFFEVAKRRDTNTDLKPFYLYLDEFQKFVSMDILAMLDEVRKFRMFTVLAHQRFGQLDEDLADAVLTNCRIKAVFGGLPVESAKMMAQELFIGELDPMKIKVAIYQTKFWPKYSRDKVYTRSSSAGRSAGRGDNQGSSSGAGSASGEFFLPGDWMTSGEMTGLSTSVSNMMTTVSASHTSETDFSLGSSARDFQSSMCLLRSQDPPIGTRPFHTAEQSGLPWDGAMEHRAGMQGVLVKQRAHASVEMVPSSAHNCRHCGTPTTVKPARIWLNSPYGTETFKWMRKFAEHKRGIALIFARTDTRGFHDHIFQSARAIYFLKGRVKFHREDGSCPKNGPAAASCLVAHTEEDTAAILSSGLPGFLMQPGNCQPPASLIQSADIHVDLYDRRSIYRP